MLIAILAILIGLSVLVWSADRFVAYSSRVALHFRLPSVLVGIFIIGLGTSAPEITVSVLASLQGNSGIALGNAFGSNITNIGLVLGCAALIRSVRVQKSILFQELPLLIGITIFTILLLSDLELTRMDGWILLSLFITFFIISGLQTVANLSQESSTTPNTPEKSILLLLCMLILSLGLLIISARAFVWGATEIAIMWGVSDLIIGLTIVAIGTSLPELAATVLAMLRKQDALAVGSVVGSNIFNTLLVVGLSGVIHPTSLDTMLLHRDLSYTMFLTVILLLVCWSCRGRGRVMRVEGVVLLVLYFLYGFVLFYTL